MTDHQKTTKILFLGANPSDKAHLRLDKEVQEIDSALRRVKYRSRFKLSQKWAVRPELIQQAILDENPKIVHFSGHGEPDGYLVWENSDGDAKSVEPAALAELFRLVADDVQCVLLNACFSEPQAEAIAQHIDYVIGMNDEISDDAARKFAVEFYYALGSGRSIEDAYALGCNAIRLQGIKEHLIPVLKVNHRRARGEASESRAESRPKKPSINTSKKSKPRILVLDNDTDWLEGINRILGTDYDITSTKTFKQAIKRLGTTQYSLVIIDLKLGADIPGLEALGEMRKVVPDLRAIILTGFPNDSSAFESGKTGALAYVNKSEADKVLKTKVEEIIKTIPI